MKRSMYMTVLFSVFVCAGSLMAQVPFSGQIYSNHTFNVPSEFSTINDALDYLADKTFADGVTVTIQVANGTYTSLAEVVVSHPQGAQIHIKGNTTTPANCSLTFTGTGFSVSNGRAIGLIDGFTIIGNNAGNGISAAKNGTINLGQNVYISYFSQGIYAAFGSTIEANYVHSSYNSGCGMLAQAGTINANYAVVDHNTQCGVAAIQGGLISFTYAETSYNAYGVQAYASGTVIVNNSNGHHNSAVGFLAQTNGMIYGSSVSYSSNGTNKSTDAYGGVINF